MFFGLPKQILPVPCVMFLDISPVFVYPRSEFFEFFETYNMDDQILLIATAVAGAILYFVIKGWQSCKINGHLN